MDSISVSPDEGDPTLPLTVVSAEDEVLQRYSDELQRYDGFFSLLTKCLSSWQGEHLLDHLIEFINSTFGPIVDSIPYQRAVTVNKIEYFQFDRLNKLESFRTTASMLVALVNQCLLSPTDIFKCVELLCIKVSPYISESRTISYSKKSCVTTRSSLSNPVSSRISDKDFFLLFKKTWYQLPGGQLIDWYYIKSNVLDTDKQPFRSAVRLLASSKYSLNVDYFDDQKKAIAEHERIVSGYVNEINYDNNEVVEPTDTKKRKPSDESCNQEKIKQNKLALDQMKKQKLEIELQKRLVLANKKKLKYEEKKKQKQLEKQQAEKHKVKTKKKEMKVTKKQAEKEKVAEVVTVEKIVNVEKVVEKVVKEIEYRTIIIAPTSSGPSFTRYSLNDVKMSDEFADRQIEACLQSLSNYIGSSLSYESGTIGTSAYINKWNDLAQKGRLAFTLPMGFIFGAIRIGRGSNNLEGEVDCIYVSPEQRKRGYGKLLYQKFELHLSEMAKSLRAKAAVIVGLKPCLHNSVSFWEEMGFPSPLNKGDGIPLKKYLNVQSETETE